MPRIYFLLFQLFITASLYGQDAPKYSNEFLTLGVGSRGFAMGGTQTAIANDVSAGYWNPAALLRVKPDYQLSLMHAQYFNGIANYDYAGFTMSPDSISRLGLSLIRFAVDDIPDTRFLYDANGNINYDNIRSFSAADYGFLISYARKIDLLGGINIGGNAKIIHRSAGIFANGWGFGIDAGAMMDHGHWSFGVMFKDITGTFTAWDHNEEELRDIYLQTGNEMPQNTWEITLPRMIIGAGRNFNLNDFNIQAAIDLVHTFDGKRNTLIKTDLISLDPRAGLEVGYKNIAFARFGVSNFQEVEEIGGDKNWTFSPSTGVGFHINNIVVDYAFTSSGNTAETLYSHIFTVLINWDRAGD